MSIRFQCRFCHQLVSVGERRTGARIRCPACGCAQTVMNSSAGAYDDADDVSAVAEASDLPYEEQPSSSRIGRHLLAGFGIGLVLALLGAGGFAVYLVIARAAEVQNTDPPLEARGDQVASLPKPRPQGSVPPNPAEKPPVPAVPQPQAKPVVELPPIKPKAPPAVDPPAIRLQNQPQVEVLELPPIKPKAPPIRPKQPPQPEIPELPPIKPKSAPKNESLLPTEPKSAPATPEGAEKPPPQVVKNKEPDPAMEVERLRTALVEASLDAQEEVLESYRTGKGEAFDLALAKAIPDLPRDLQGKGRDALYERLAELPLKTLRARLQDERREMRCVAALVCKEKRLRELVPDLIERLADSDEAVIWNARRALKAITGQDCGPQPGASPAARAQIVAFWHRWWKQHGQK